MATRKEKHARGLARREEYLREEEERNLRILQGVQEKRARELRDEWREQHDKKHFKFITECPLCQDAKRDLAKKEKSETAKKAVEKMAARVST